jgi:hypothetical protein
VLQYDAEGWARLCRGLCGAGDLELRLTNAGYYRLDVSSYQLSLLLLVVVVVVVVVLVVVLVLLSAVCCLSCAGRTGNMLLVWSWR